ncbi:MAG: DUF3089 domain-containing protein [Bacteroidota bacterium]|nr:DUF3089 domain-containing protein [Bacteroidota bacterium]
MLILLISCNKEDNISPDNSTGENVTILVQPNLTDANYSLTDNSHYVVRNSKTHLNKLLLFIGGSFSSPNDYSFICEHAASIGLDVISISYPNGIPAAFLASNSDQFIFDNYRDEICLGNQVSNEVSVNNLNSIITRATKLIQYLKNTYPDQNWGQYLTSLNNLQWDKIIIAGHSQGAGHACYLGKKRLADRVVMFSGPNDYSTHYNSPANWVLVSGLTPLSKQYALLHTQDEIISYEFQVSNLKGLGILSTSETPLLVDDLSTPYDNKNVLSLNISAFTNHNSTVGGNSKLPSIWTYLLTKE